MTGMLSHNFKIAVRNLLKNKTQSIISMVGLAIGFTCFALSALWIRYEMTYDSQHSGSDRMYLLYHPAAYMQNGYSVQMVHSVSETLKREYAEVEDVCAFFHWKGYELEVEGRTQEVTVLGMDADFIDMFQVRLLSGNRNFMHDSEQVALTEKTALQLFGSTDVIGKKVKLSNQPKTVCALLKGLEHSSLEFDVCAFGSHYQEYKSMDDYMVFNIVIRLREGVSSETFQQKLSVPENRYASLNDLRLIPLSEYHRSELNVDRSVKFYYLILFSATGGLIILSALLNYLSFFVTRLQLRHRELALRHTCGASKFQLWGMLATEYLVIIGAAGFVGFTLMELLLPAFRRLSEVERGIYGEALVYLAVVALLSLILLVPQVCRQSAQRHRAGYPYLLRKCGILLQLVIGMIFIFCVSVLMKQILYLTDSDLGWERNGNASFRSLYPRTEREAIADEMTRLPSVKEVLKNHIALLPPSIVVSYCLIDWPGKSGTPSQLDMMVYAVDNELADFYRLKLLEGEMLCEEDTAQMLLNETAVKTLGIQHPVGQYLKTGDGNGLHTFRIKGVLKDFKLDSPTMPVKPVLLVITGRNPMEKTYWTPLVKYRDGKWKELKRDVDSLLARKFPDVKYELVDTQSIYDEYLSSEHLLLQLLGISAFVCICVATFGIFSFVTLSCERRRKEIAVRKVNGATIKDILLMFVKEYAILLGIASIIAFPIGYVLMKQWLERYVEQTDISAWIYIAIFAGIAVLIALCIGWRIWQAARQNPAETIKQELR